MKLTFTKGSGKFDRLDIVSAAGPLAPVACPKQGIIPHDMVHFAVESQVAGLGFLGLATRSGDTGFSAAIDDPHASAIERLVETVQAEAWGGNPAPDADFIALYHVTCDARGDKPLALDAATIAAIRTHLADLTARWQAVPVGGSLLLTLDVQTAR